MSTGSPQIDQIIADLHAGTRTFQIFEYAPEDRLSGDDLAEYIATGNAADFWTSYLYRAQQRDGSHVAIEALLSEYSVVDGEGGLIDISDLPTAVRDALAEAVLDHGEDDPLTALAMQTPALLRIHLAVDVDAEAITHAAAGSDGDPAPQILAGAGIAATEVNLEQLRAMAAERGRYAGDLVAAIHSNAYQGYRLNTHGGVLADPPVLIADGLTGPGMTPRLFTGQVPVSPGSVAADSAQAQGQHQSPDPHPADHSATITIAG